MTKLLFLAGSARKNSFNKKLALLASQTIQQPDIETTFIDLKDFPMPIYDGDLEEKESLPENARHLKKVFSEHDGFFIASPEYNSSFSPLLKNTLDWISRPHEKNETPLIAFNGKTVALGAVSPGALGGLRGLVPLRMMLGNIGVTVLPQQVAISNGIDAFDDDGHLKDKKQADMLQNTLNALAETTRALTR